MNLTREDIFEIAKFKAKNDAVSFIRTKIPTNYRSISDVWRHEIQLDIIVDLVDFCLKKSFTVNQCLICLTLNQEIIRLIKKPSSKLNNVLDMFMESLKNLSTDLNEKNMKDLIDYMTSTIFTHFNLYKYVFNFDRDDHTGHQKKTLVSPEKGMIEAFRLSESKPYTIWEYEQKVAELDNREKINREKFIKEREKLFSEEENAKSLIRYIQNDAYGNDKPLDDEAMKNLINEMSMPLLKITNKIIKSEIDEIKAKMDLNYQRNALAKPNEKDDLRNKPKGSTPASAKAKKK